MLYQRKLIQSINFERTDMDGYFPAGKDYHQSFDGWSETVLKKAFVLHPRVVVVTSAPVLPAKGG